MISILILDTLQHMSIQLPHQVILKLNQNKNNDPSVSKQIQLLKKEHHSRVVHTKVIKSYPSSLRTKNCITCLAVLSFNPLIYAPIPKIYLINQHSLIPLWSPLLAKTHHGVIYDFNFFSHGWPHYFILLSAQNLAKWQVEKAIKSVKTNFIQTSWCTEKYWDKGIVVWRATRVSKFWPMVTCRNWLNKLIDTSPSGKK